MYSLVLMWNIVRKSMMLQFTILYTEEEYTQIVDNYRTLSLKTVKQVTTLLDTHLPN